MKSAAGVNLECRKSDAMFVCSVSHTVFSFRVSQWRVRFVELAVGLI